ncbi:unnamed protein product [Leptosia nina]|uniref:CCAAT-binding factor domain-containing protein n=1 Tax=Leptosia nina TaxID=320188 RepID=A0AAV1JKB1_9NEOP
MLFLISQVLKDAKKKDAIKLVWTKKELDEVEKKENDTETGFIEENAEAEESQISITEENRDVTNKEREEEKDSKKVDLLIGDKKDLLIDDEEEAYVDLKIDDEGNIKPKKRAASAVSGWYHAKVKTEEVSEDKEMETKKQLKKTINMQKVILEYNPFARNPAYCGASCSAYFELLPLTTHFHPTVKLFAQRLINNQIIQYSGDPLKDFSGIRFLDRFVFKNPKKPTEKPQENELKKVKGSHPKFAIRKNYTPKGLRSIPVNSASYLNEDVSKIPVDEQFLYDFLKKRRTEADSDDDSDNDSVTSEDFNQYLDKMTGTKAQESDEEELDYLSEMQASLQQKPKKGEDMSEEELEGDDEDDDVGGEDDELPIDDDDSDGELNISGDEDEPALSGEENEWQLDNSDEDDDVIDVPGKKSAKGKKLKIKGGDSLGSLFASAEEFSTLLEETAANKKQGSSQAVSNTDNASVKQLAWEEKRDRWIKGYNKNILGKKSNKKRFNKKSVNGAADNNRGKRKAGRIDGAGGKKKKTR